MQHEVEAWLKNLARCWRNQDINGILNLFTEDVEYWETPFNRIKTHLSLRKEWQNIIYQKNINLELNLYSSQNDKHTIVWNLKYTNAKNTTQIYKGIYLIKLNKQGLCNYFLQCTESK